MGKWVGNGQVGWNRAPHSRTAGRGMGRSRIGDCPKLRNRTTCAARHGRGTRAGGLFDYFEVLTQEWNREGEKKILKNLKRIKLRTGRVRKRITWGLRWGSSGVCGPGSDPGSRLPICRGELGNSGCPSLASAASDSLTSESRVLAGPTGSAN
jgi:hypothetical protein